LVRVGLVEHPPVVLEVKATTLFFLPLLLQVVVLVEVALAPLTEDRVVQVAAVIALDWRGQEILHLHPPARVIMALLAPPAPMQPVVVVVRVLRDQGHLEVTELRQL